MKFVEVDLISSGHYLVTCEHCIKDAAKARFCIGDPLPIQPTDWSMPASGDDVAAIDITDLIESRPGISSIDAGMSCTKRENYMEFPGLEKVEKLDRPFGIGTDIYMLGFLAEEKDTGANAPRARFGNLSAYARDGVDAEQGNGKLRPCHLGDMRSRSGFSGSPVFGYIDSTVLDGNINTKTRFFGMHSAQPRDRVPVYGNSDFQWIEIASSMTRIVPAWAIVELLEKNETFRSARANRR